MKKIILILGFVFSFGVNYKMVEASSVCKTIESSSLNLSSEFLDEETGVYIIPFTEDVYSVYGSRAVSSVSFSGTATHQIDITSMSFSAPKIVQVTFNYVSPQTYDVGFEYTLQSYSTTKGWVDVDSVGLTAKSTIKKFSSNCYFFSNKTGPYRVLIRTGSAHGVKITNGLVSSLSSCG